jgi:hypothetical protein
MAKKGKFSNIAEMTEGMRKERMGHMSTEVKEVPSNVKREDQGKDEGDEIQKEENPIVGSEAKREISSTPLPEEKKENKPVSETGSKGEYTDKIRITPIWNQVLTIMYKNNKKKYSCREDLLYELLEKAVKNDEKIQEVKKFVSKLYE